MGKKVADQGEIKIEFPLSAVIEMYSIFEEIKEKWADDPETHPSINHFELEIKKDDFHYRMGKISMKDVLTNFKLDDLYHQAKAELPLTEGLRLYISFLQMEHRLPRKALKDVDYENKRARFMMALEENKLRSREWKEMRPFPFVHLSFDVEEENQAEVIPIRQNSGRSKRRLPH